MKTAADEKKQVEEKRRGMYGIVAITKHGVEIGRKLNKMLPQSDLFYPSKFERGDESEYNIQTYEGSVKLALPALFPNYRGLIFIVSIGAVVRLIAPYLKDKKTDPGVVVIDDKAEHVISVLSGHLGGANELTNEVAALLDARPVITTASEVQQTIPVDLFGKRFGWVWESEENLIPVSASVVNEEKIAIVQESGERNWWQYDRPIPDNITVYPSVADAISASPQASLVITHRLLREEEKPLLENGVLYRPKVVVLGMGCNRGTSAEEIEEVIQETLLENQLSIKSVKAICTIDLKKDEAGFLEIVKKYGWDFITYAPDELNEVSFNNPSDVVFKYTGAYGVSEPAALLYSGADDLIVEKKKSGNVTISVAVIPHDKEEQ
jgi:cobalt-precorrin 5A hydrolase